MHLGFINIVVMKKRNNVSQIDSRQTHREKSQWGDTRTKQCISVPTYIHHRYGPFRTVNLEKIDTANEENINIAREMYDKKTSIFLLRFCVFCWDKNAKNMFIVPECGRISNNNNKKRVHYLYMKTSLQYFGFSDFGCLLLFLLCFIVFCWLGRFACIV